MAVMAFFAVLVVVVDDKVALLFAILVVMIVVDQQMSLPILLFLFVVVVADRGGNFPLYWSPTPARTVHAASDANAPPIAQRLTLMLHAPEIAEKLAAVLWRPMSRCHIHGPTSTAKQTTGVVLHKIPRSQIATWRLTAR